MGRCVNVCREGKLICKGLVPERMRGTSVESLPGVHDSPVNQKARSTRTEEILRIDDLEPNRERALFNS
jgi:hypothetical protein